MNEVQRKRDTFRNKYLDYICKFNAVEQERDKIKQEANLIYHENIIVKQENVAIKQENITAKQEIDELTNLLEPMRRSLNKTIKKYRDIKQENEDLYLFLEPVLGITNILPRDTDSDNTPKDSDQDTDRDKNIPKESKQARNREDNNPQKKDQDTVRVDTIEESDNLHQKPSGTTAIKKLSDKEIPPFYKAVTDMQKTITQVYDTTLDKPSTNKGKRKKRKSIDKRKSGKRTRKI